MPVVAVFAPPELLIVTRGADPLPTVVLDSKPFDGEVEPDVAGDVFDGDDEVMPVDELVPIDEVVPVDGDGVVPVDEVVWVDAEVPLDWLADESPVEESVSVGCAHAAGVVATAHPTPRAIANPPTRPMYFAVPMMISSPVEVDADLRALAPMRLVVR